MNCPSLGQLFHFAFAHESGTLTGTDVTQPSATVTCYFSATLNNKTKPVKSKVRRKQHHQEANMESKEATMFMVCMTVILIMDDDIRRLRSRLEEHTVRVSRQRIV